MSEISGRLSGGPEEGDPADEEPLVLRPDDQGMRWLRRHAAGSAAVVTTVVDGAYRGATVTAWLVASLQPPLLAVSIDLESQMDGWLQASRSFALSLLPWNQQFLADQFAGFAPLASRVFRGIDHDTGVTGSPVLARAIAWADCSVVQVWETGDHRLFLGEIVGLGRGGGQEDDPLLYFLNRYRRLG